ncbi:ATP-binding cassette domain-containing protein [Meiothermus granaticius]|uniref:Ribose import ATP-binding protein RbsA n=1 Tax=Meiothermus granaticius NBRC 107808 TaxID=1227551 RepID=A0A399FC00_9DEIN|nr:ATP-binding cassette domain-containing protein [Meiothermus granaticius]MCL6525846.1 ATP-binding cassette domain-containing protein [Thermaceae bacterium]RIH92221.1 Ribose import ATP-binding protein RbsA [Meiothermus granaticius NBRC 107808]GEM85602.1 sugar ABC transporter ATP-binding protein [Meiothermus granaticius NBRC 107808]
MTPLIEMKHISLRFGGNQALKDVSVNLYPGEVLGLLGHNGAGKSTLIKVLSGAYQADSGQIFVEGQEVQVKTPQDSQRYGIETIYQNLALADNLDAVANVFLGREKVRGVALDEDTMELEARNVLDRLRIRIPSLRVPVQNMSGGQRQSVAIGRAIYFKAKCLIMDEPTAALGPEETRKVGELIKALKSEGVGIFLISHDLHDVFDLSDRLTVMKNGAVVGTVNTKDVTHDDVLGMIIGGVMPKGVPSADDQAPTA